MTQRQEIEKLIDKYKASTKIKSENIQWDNGFNVCANSVGKDLTDILSRHTEPEPEPTAPSQRERIATAIMLELIRNSSNPEWTYAMLAEPSVTATDALIAELSKTKTP